ncbi:MAG: NlpC/P60 family protein [Pseudomonadota bacterium]
MTAGQPPRVARSEIVAATRAWIGTPYHHQASRVGIGADCLGLVRGVWRDVYGADAEAPPAYSRDWAEAHGEETLLAAAGRNMEPVARSAMRPGDLIVFRYRPGLVAKHVGILTGENRFVHAMERVPVAEVALGPWWRRRVAGVFSFPGVVD